MLLATVFAVSATILQLIDFATTLITLKHGGGEANRYLRALMNRIGQTPGLLLAKALAVVLIVALWRLGYALPLGVIVAWYLYIAWNNLTVMRGLGLI